MHLSRVARSKSGAFRKEYMYPHATFFSILACKPLHRHDIITMYAPIVKEDL